LLVKADTGKHSGFVAVIVGKRKVSYLLTSKEDIQQVVDVFRKKLDIVVQIFLTNLILFMAGHIRGSIISGVV
jgi:hypothetical protein